MHLRLAFMQLSLCTLTRRSAITTLLPYLLRSVTEHQGLLTEVAVELALQKHTWVTYPG